MRAHGVEFEPRARALPFGDYVADNGSNVAVDTKKDVQELAMDCGRDHARFRRELERAQEAGFLLVVLVECHQEFSDRARLRAWTHPVCLSCRRCNPREKGRCQKMRSGRKPMQGAQIAGIIGKWEEEFTCRFEFCRRLDTARRICELLGVPHDGG